MIHKVGHYAYRLELPPTMRIHPVVSVAQLEPANGQDQDPYHRVLNKEPPPVQEVPEAHDDEYVIERLLDKRVNPGGRTKYLVKWLGWGAEHNVWYDIKDLDNAGELVKAYEDRQPQLPPRDTRVRRSQRTRQTIVRRSQRRPDDSP